MSQVKTFQKNPGWIASILGNTTKIAGKEIACGFPKGMAQAYPGGEPVASVAARNCWGIETTQRDFMSYAVPGIVKATQALMVKIIRLNNLSGDHSGQINDLRERAGMAAANQIKLAIRNGPWEPNSGKPMGYQLRDELTKNWGVKIPNGMSYRAAKYKFHKSDKPLIDTGHLVLSTTYIVRDR